MSAPAALTPAERVRAVLYRIFGHLPVDWVSAIGSLVVRRNVHRNLPEIIEGAKVNLRIHRPQASEAELDAMVEEFLDGVGRLMAEFAVMPRFICEGRLEARGAAAFKAIAGTRPIIAFGLHTGNWETFGPMFEHLGIPLASFYMPPEGTFDRMVAEQSRARFGVQLLRQDALGAREGLRLLRRNRTVMIFPDEAMDGQARGPLFGRPPHGRGNLAVAARLARHSGASFVICHSVRTKGARFVLDFSPVFDLPPVEERPDLLADVAFLNARIEPVILENIPRWYFLNDSISPIGI